MIDEKAKELCSQLYTMRALMSLFYNDSKLLKKSADSIITLIRSEANRVPENKRDIYLSDDAKIWSKRSSLSDGAFAAMGRLTREDLNNNTYYNHLRKLLKLFIPTMSFDLYRHNTQLYYGKYHSNAGAYCKTLEAEIEKEIKNPTITDKAGYQNACQQFNEAKENVNKTNEEKNKIIECAKNYVLYGSWQYRLVEPRYYEEKYDYSYNEWIKRKRKDIKENKKEILLGKIEIVIGVLIFPLLFISIPLIGSGRDDIQIGSKWLAKDQRDEQELISEFKEKYKEELKNVEKALKYAEEQRLTKLKDLEKYKVRLQELKAELEYMRRFETYIRMQQEGEKALKEIYDKKINPLLNEMRNISNILRTIYGKILDVRDWKYLDYIIYCLETNRADTLRDCLLLADRERQTQDIVNATKHVAGIVMSSSQYLAQTIHKGFNNLSGEIQKLSLQVERTNDNLERINTNIDTVNRNISAVNSNLNDVKGMQLQQLSEQRLQTALLQEINTGVDDMIDSVNSIDVNPVTNVSVHVSNN